MEVMVSLAIFSMTVTIVFAIFVNSISQRRASEGYGIAVTLVDGFLAERKLLQDGVVYFFPEEAARSIREGHAGSLGEGVITGREFLRTNGSHVFRIRLRSQILEIDPLIYRAYVSCYWKIRARGEEREKHYAVATVFIRPLSQTNR